MDFGVTPTTAMAGESDDHDIDRAGSTLALSVGEALFRTDAQQQATAVVAPFLAFTMFRLVTRSPDLFPFYCHLGRDFFDLLVRFSGLNLPVTGRAALRGDGGDGEHPRRNRGTMDDRSRR